MRRRLIPLLVLALTIVPPLAAAGRNPPPRSPDRESRSPAPRWRTHVSPHTELTYEYLEGPLSYRLPTSFGWLSLGIRQGPTEIIALSGPDEDWSVLLYETPGGGLRASWRTRDVVLTFDVRETGEPVMIQQAEPLLCDPIWGSATRRALFEIEASLVEELGLNPSPHESSVSLFAAVHLVTSLAEGLSGCRDVNPQAAGCYYDNPLFDDCVSCCEADAEIFSVICLTGVWGICQGKSCRALMFICGGLMEVQASGCISHNCRGKPGDPSCPDNLPCQGVCMAFCGPGYSSACGECPVDSPQQECCQ